MLKQKTVDDFFDIHTTLKQNENLMPAPYLNYKVFKPKGTCNRMNSTKFSLLTLKAPFV
jgi:hypothetical protein